MSIEENRGCHPYLKQKANCFSRFYISRILLYQKPSEITTYKNVRNETGMAQSG